MPVIARFDGILVYMNLHDHAPPHFHVRYGGEDATVQISPLQLMDARIPISVWREVRRWAEGRESELLALWLECGGAEDRSERGTIES